MDTFRFNLLMMVAVTMRVDPLQQGYCRSAGSVGFTAYEELVALRSLHSVHCCAGLDDDHVWGTVNHYCWVGGFCCAEVSTDDVGTCTASTDKCTEDGDDVSSQSDNEVAGMSNPMHAPFSDAYLCTGKTPARYSYGADIEKVEPPSRTVGGKVYRYIVKVICDEEFQGSAAWDVAKMDVTFVWNPTLPTKLYLTTFGFPKHAGSVRFVGFETVTSLQEEFCCECAPVHFPDLSSFVNVTTIGDDFFAYSGVTAIDFTPMINVTSIGERFLHSCEELTFVELTGFINVTSIGSDFVTSCDKLEPLCLGGLGGIASLDRCNNGCHLMNISLSLYDEEDAILTRLSVVPHHALRRLFNVVNDVTIPDCIQEDYPHTVTSLDLVPLQHVTTIWGSFLHNCDNMTALDTSMLNLQRIGENFASECELLESVDLSGLRAVTAIPSNFLNKGDCLKSIDLSPLSQVTTIEHDCFADCLSLTALDLSCMSMLESIGCGFATCCESLTSLTLPRPSRVHTLGPQFAKGCTSLQSVDISGMECLTTIDFHFLADCSALTSLKCDGCVGITSIDSSFMSGCTSLQSLDLSGMSVTTLGSDFASGCSGLTSVNLSGLSGVKVIDARFMMGCSSLVSLDLSPLSKVTEINSDFMSGCTSLQSLELSGMSVTTLGSDFASGCSGLTSVNLSGLSGVKVIDARFMMGCSSLTSIDLSPLSRVIKINSDFMACCTSLTNIDISMLRTLNVSVPDRFLDGCSSLGTVDLSNLTISAAKHQQLLMEAERQEQERIDRYRAEQLIAEQKKIAHQKQLAERNKIAHQKRMSERMRLAHQQKLAEEKRIAHQKQLAKEKRIAHQKRMTEQKRAASERKKSSRR